MYSENKTQSVIRYSCSWVFETTVNSQITVQVIMIIKKKKKNGQHLTKPLALIQANQPNSFQEWVSWMTSDLKHFLTVFKMQHPSQPHPGGKNHTASTAKRIIWKDIDYLPIEEEEEKKKNITTTRQQGHLPSGTLVLANTQNQSPHFPLTWSK